MSITSTITETDLATSLRAVVRGDVVTANEPSFPAAVFGLRSSGNFRPELVVVAADATDIAAAVRVAIRANRRIVVQTPQQPGSLTADRTILVVTRLLAGVRIDPDSRTARIGAGSTWRQVMDAAERFGLAAVPGPVSAPGRPVGRTFGFAAGQVRSLQVVTAAGELREIDARRDPELFDAARRAGGTGWITAMTVALVPAEELYTGRMFFDAADAPAVRKRWDGWAAGLPATADSWITPVSVPAVREVPAPLRGRSVIVLRFVQVGDVVTAARQLDPMRAAATPLLDVAGVVPVRTQIAVKPDAAQN